MFNQPNNYGQQPTARAPQQSVNLPGLDSILSGGARGFFNADSTVGATVTGTVESVEVTQYHDFQTKEPGFWRDGKPMTQIHIILQTNLHDSPDDEGQRSLWIKGWGTQVKALKAACQKAGVGSPVKGDTMTATFTGYGERGNAPQPPKVYEYVIRHESAAAQVLNSQPAAASYAQAPAQAPAAVNPAASYMQPQAPQQTVPQPQQPAFDVNQVRQFAVLGKTIPEIQGLTGARPDQIQTIIDQVRAEQNTDPAEAF
jgi:hypothetical protein